jgi:diguanylate cyclase (GGDEF)-like protein
MDHDILLETIVAITEQRDQQSLELSLLASLREMLQPTTSIFLDLPLRDVTQRVQTVSGEIVSVPEQVIKMASEMSELDFCQVKTTGMTYMMGMMGNSKGVHRRVLLVGMPNWSETSERMLVGMVRVYQNFMKLMSDSEMDTLTGLQNRRKLESFLASRLSARLHQRRESDKSAGDAIAMDRGEYLAVLDLDKFKRINDTFGHLIGDEVLLTFANILRASLRDNDRSFRYGGEEFIVVLNEVNADQAEMILERLRGNVERHAFPQVGQVTVSIGYTMIDRQDLPTQVIEEADKALYFAKEHGRNQIREFSALREEGAVEDTHQHDGSIELF